MWSQVSFHSKLDCHLCWTQSPVQELLPCSLPAHWWTVLLSLSCLSELCHQSSLWLVTLPPLEKVTLPVIKWLLCIALIWYWSLLCFTLMLSVAFLSGFRCSWMLWRSSNLQCHCYIHVSTGVPTSLFDLELNGLWLKGTLSTLSQDPCTCSCVPGLNVSMSVECWIVMSEDVNCHWLSILGCFIDCILGTCFPIWCSCWGLGPSIDQVLMADVASWFHSSFG